MKKYMIVYSFRLSDGKKCTEALFADTEKEKDAAIEYVRVVYVTKTEVYIYTIYGYQLLFR